jgi:hypothetical protein
MNEAENKDISIVRIENEKEIQRYNLDQLAVEMTGKPTQRLFPIYLVFHHGRCRGYFQAPVQTIIYPTIHPELLHLKEYQELVSSLVTEMKRMTGNPIFLLCDRAEKLGDKLLKTFRLKRTTETAYEYDEGG